MKNSYFGRVEVPAYKKPKKLSDRQVEEMAHVFQGLPSDVKREDVRTNGYTDREIEARINKWEV